MKIAHFSPLPPQQTGIADYCADLLPYLANLAAVDIYAPPVSSAIRGLSLPVRPISDFLNTPVEQYEYDICLYHMGNHPTYHESIYATMMRYPGITVLHEVNLHAFYQHRPADGKRAAYVREMGYAYGTTGLNMARQVVAGFQMPDTDQFPLFQRIANSSLGIIVHTEFARRALLTAVPQARVTHIPLGVRIPDKTTSSAPPAWRAQFPPDAVLVGAMGIVAASKRIEIVLQALSRLKETVPDFYFLLVGESVPGYDLTAVIERMGLGDIVHQTGYVAEEAFESYLDGIDIGVNLRTGPTGGEMSAALVRLLAHGRPTIVSDVGGFANLPEHCVIKIKQDENEVAALETALRQLILHADVRSRYSQAARRFIEDNYSFSQVAQQYMQFIKTCLETAVSGGSHH
jgi:glycosyltransferase involved in cell wall biosynthesis